MADWNFGTANQREGNIAGIDIFVGDRLQSVIRETVQNSLDARESDDHPAKVSLSLDTLPIKTSDELSALAPFVAKASEANNKLSEDSHAPSNRFYENAQELLAADTITFLSIHDCNTAGLTGDSVDVAPDVKFGPWLALVRSNGVTMKARESDLGSFGHGSMAPFTISGVRTVFYLSQLPASAGAELRFQAKSILQSMPISDGGFTSATGFWSAGSVKEGLPPLIGDSVPGWARKIREANVQGQGTSILIAAPAIESTDEFWYRTKLAVIASFYFAILRDRLQVDLGNGEQIRKDNIGAITQSLIDQGLFDDDSVTEKLRENLDAVVTVHRVTHDPPAPGQLLTGLGSHSEFGTYEWFLRVGDDTKGRRVGIARGHGMLITRRAPKLELFPTLKPFDLFVCVTGETGSKILRSLENPQHTSFEFDQVQDIETRKEVRKKYESFAQEIRELVKSHASYTVGDELQSDDLDLILGGDGPLDVDRSPDETSKRIVIRETKVRTREGANTDIVLDAEDSDDEVDGPRIGAGSIKKPGGGQVPNPGPRVKRLGKQVKGLHVEPAGATGKVRVSFTPTVQTGDWVFRLLIANETSKGRASVAYSHKGLAADDGGLVIHVSDRSRKHIDIELKDVSNLSLAFEAALYRYEKVDPS